MFDSQIRGLSRTEAYSDFRGPGIAIVKPLSAGHADGAKLCQYPCCATHFETTPDPSLQFRQTKFRKNPKPRTGRARKPHPVYGPHAQHADVGAEQTKMIDSL